MRVNSITAIGTLTALNFASADSLVFVPSRCSIPEALLRTTVEDAPGQAGVFVEPPLAGAQIITLGGYLNITSVGTDAAYLAAMDTLEGVIKTALAALQVAPDDLVSGAGTISVWQYAPYEPTFDEEAKVMNVVFGLIVDNGL